MKIVVDPLDPSNLTTTFFGPSKYVEMYRDIYREKSEDWNAKDDIYTNFLKVFGEFDLVCSKCKKYISIQLCVQF